MSVAENQLITQSANGKSNLPVAGSTRIFQGTLVFVSATGYADDDTNSGANAFAGIATEEADNSAGAAGDLNVELLTDGVIQLQGSGFTQADVGKKVYATDNYTLTKTASSNTYIGHIREFVSATVVGVNIEPGAA